MANQEKGKKKESHWGRIKAAVGRLLKWGKGEYRYWKETTSGPPRKGTYATYGITPCIAAWMRQGVSREEATKRCRAAKGGK